MIKGNNTNELNGQLDLTDVLNEGNPSTAFGGPPPLSGEAREPTTPEGYDADGHLLDYAPPAQKPPLKGEGDRAAVEGLLSAATPSEAPDRLTALAVEINAITEQTRGVVISAALAVGKRLIEAKSLCPEGRWTEWLAKSVNYSERKAQDMMRLYAEYGRDGQIPDSIAALDYSKAVALLSAPAEAREELAIKAEAEDLSVRQLQAEIKALKEENAKAQTMIEWKDQEKEKHDQTFNDVMGELEKQIEENTELEDKLNETRASAAEKIAAANAKADAAESAAAELRKLHSDAEDRAAANAQRASDAVNRANQTAKDLAEARAEIARLREEAERAEEAKKPPLTGEGDRVSGGGVETVEVIPESVTRELEDLRAQLAEAQAALQKPPLPPRLRQGEGDRVSGGGVASTSATDRFKLFYTDTMKPAFTTALNLLREVAREDGKAADMFATALTNGCKTLMNQLGTRD